MQLVTRNRTLVYAGLSSCAWLCIALFVSLQITFWLLPLFILIAAYFAKGTFGANQNFFGKMARPKKAANNQLQVFSLTFDDGPNPKTTLCISKLLREAGFAATFFVLGQNAEKYPEVLDQLIADGHEIANHTFSHHLLAFSGPRKIRDEIIRQEQVIQKFTQNKPIPLLRAPHGFKSPFLIHTARKIGYQVCGWNGGIFDTADPGAGVIAERANKLMRANAVLLLHDGNIDGEDRGQTAEALPEIIQAARNLNLRSIKLSELLEIS